MKRRQFLASCAALVAAPVLPKVLPEPELPAVGEYYIELFDHDLISTQTLAEALSVPLRNGVLSGDIIGNVYEVVECKPEFEQEIYF